MTDMQLQMRPALSNDLERLQSIRAIAFAPIFASFRSILGDTVYQYAQADEDQSQGELLDSISKYRASGFAKNFDLDPFQSLHL